MACAERYATAWETGDVEAIVGMLSEDAKPPETEWYQGHHDIRAFIIEGPETRHWRFLPAHANGANGQLAFGTYMWEDDRAVYVAVDSICSRCGARRPPKSSHSHTGDLFDVRAPRRGHRGATGPAMSSAAAVGCIGMTNETKQIRALIEQWAAAVHSGDMDGASRTTPMTS
jgi:hypothetical protein